MTNSTVMCADQNTQIGRYLNSIRPHCANVSYRRIQDDGNQEGGNQLASQSAVLGREDIFEAAGRIDPLPASITRLLELSSDPDASLVEVADVIRYDPVLSVDLLRRANSATSAAHRKIEDVADAVSRLGTSEVLIMAMRRAMQGRMSDPIPAYGLDANAMWRHALAAAVAAEVIAHQSPVRIPAMASTAALLHDVGKLVIAESLAPSVIEYMVSSAEQSNRPLHEVEAEILGADHAEIGGVVLRGWAFPMSVQIAVTRHHDVSSNADTLTHAVAAANAIADVLPDEGETEPNAPLDDAAVQSLQACGIPQRRMPVFLELVSARFNEVLASY